MGTRKVILLLENEENDLFFFRRALAACDFQGTLRVVESMAEARDYLDGRGKFQDRAYFPMPDLIVADFKLPGPTGVEFIQWLRHEKRFDEIPVIMLSGSALGTDRDRALASGAVAFYTKSANFNEMCDAVNQILTRLRPAR